MEGKNVIGLIEAEGKCAEDDGIYTLSTCINTPYKFSHRALVHTETAKGSRKAVLSRLKELATGAVNEEGCPSWKRGIPLRLEDLLKELEKVDEISCAGEYVENSKCIDDFGVINGSDILLTIRCGACASRCSISCQAIRADISQTALY